MLCNLRLDTFPMVNKVFSTPQNDPKRSKRLYLYKAILWFQRPSPNGRCQTAMIPSDGKSPDWTDARSIALLLSGGFDKVRKLGKRVYENEDQKILIRNAINQISHISKHHQNISHTTSKARPCKTTHSIMNQSQSTWISDAPSPFGTTHPTEGLVTIWSGYPTRVRSGSATHGYV